MQHPAAHEYTRQLNELIETVAADSMDSADVAMHC